LEMVQFKWIGSSIANNKTRFITEHTWWIFLDNIAKTCLK